MTTDLQSPASPTDGWLRDGSLLYRLTDERHPQNRDEINVTMVDGSRSDAARAARAEQILTMLAAAPSSPCAPAEPAAQGGEREHELKTDPVVFQQVKRGEKTFEIRKDDRGFAVGDVLHLRETAYTGEEMLGGRPLLYTGDELRVRVLSILRGPIYGLADGWVILSIATPAPASPCASTAAAAVAVEPVAQSTLPHPGSPEASAMIDSLLAEYGWPANAKNAARAGYVAAQRLLAAPQPSPGAQGSEAVRAVALPNPGPELVAMLNSFGRADLEHVANTVKAYRRGELLELIRAYGKQCAEASTGPAPACGLSEEQIDRHTISAGECPPQSKVMLVSSIKRLLARARLTHPDATKET